MADGTGDAERLAGHVETWWQAIDDFTALLEELPPEDWSKPTDLPGWDVHAVAAHTAHLEAVLAGHPEETIEIDQPDHVTSLMGMYTEQGVVARRERTPDELIQEIRESATTRHTALLADPPQDATARPDTIFGGLGWDWNTLLRNRPLDVWMHEQDVRRAVGRPGNLDGAPARHTADYLIEALGVVVGKRVAPPAGTTVVLDVDGHEPAAVEVGEDGRARPLPPPEEPSVRLRCSREDFIVLAGGRRTPESLAITVEGDRELGDRVLQQFGITP